MLENASKLFECVLRARVPAIHMAVEHDVCAAGAVVRRVGERLVQIAPRVAVRLLDRFLRARKDDGLQVALHKVRHRRRGVGHRIRAVRDHKAVVLRVAVADDLREMHPLPPAHVRAVQAVRLHGVDRAHRADLRHGVQKLLRGDRRRQGRFRFWPRRSCRRSQ